eukprot:gnl/Hemi2/3696_TR1290_c0_g1_i1.p1 gnl/Hemi2/3696_TR1290_c0_g1~~gnl/Hemi2/3696_TR1290_c0_g1_i1.p1  ORF type:complete len:146 (+),score=42.45 gnl/Hemi2/3696_TR1290_c0_g1_i1:42-440(+)
MVEEEFAQQHRAHTEEAKKGGPLLQGVSTPQQCLKVLEDVRFREFGAAMMAQLDNNKRALQAIIQLLDHSRYIPFLNSLHPLLLRCLRRVSSFEKMCCFVQSCWRASYQKKAQKHCYQLAEAYKQYETIEKT